MCGSAIDKSHVLYTRGYKLDLWIYQSHVVVHLDILTQSANFELIM